MFYIQPADRQAGFQVKGYFPLFFSAVDMLFPIITINSSVSL